MNITTELPWFARSVVSTWSTPLNGMKVSQVAIPKTFNMTLLVDVSSVRDTLNIQLINAYTKK